MRTLEPATTLLLLVLWGCNAPALPSEYRNIPIPEARLASAEGRRHGRQLFLDQCAICHGERADGRGRRQNLSSSPRDFTNPAWRQRSSPRWVYYVIREGRPGTAMAGWKSLDPDQTWDLVAYLLAAADEAH